MNYLVVSEKPASRELFERLKSKLPGSWHLIDKKEDFNRKNVAAISPDKIFVPHWSYIIPEEIFANFETVVFHMTDLPFGRGGSPLQNLILQGFKETKISALKVVRELDAGDIYLKKDLSLTGSAREIYERAHGVIEQMISEIIEKKLTPAPQIGKAVTFTRRKPGESEMSQVAEIKSAYDFIRMLDADGYPHAFLESEHLKFEFTNAALENDNSVTANVRITKK